MCVLAANLAKSRRCSKREASSQAAAAPLAAAAAASDSSVYDDAADRMSYHGADVPVTTKPLFSSQPSGSGDASANNTRKTDDISVLGCVLLSYYIFL